MGVPGRLSPQPGRIYWLNEVGLRVCVREQVEREGRKRERHWSRCLRDSRGTTLAMNRALMGPH